MRFIIWWFRSMFCNHAWNYAETPHIDFTKDVDGNIVHQLKTMRVSVTCTKCGWHRSYDKYS